MRSIIDRSSGVHRRRSRRRRSRPRRRPRRRRRLIVKANCIRTMKIHDAR